MPTSHPMSTLKTGSLGTCPRGSHSEACVVHVAQLLAPGRCRWQECTGGPHPQQGLQSMAEDHQRPHRLLLRPASTLAPLGAELAWGHPLRVRPCAPRSATRVPLVCGWPTLLVHMPACLWLSGRGSREVFLGSTDLTLPSPWPHGRRGHCQCAAWTQSLVLGLSAPRRHLASLFGSAPALPLHRRAAAPAPPAPLRSAHHPSWRWVLLLGTA